MHFAYMETLQHVKRECADWTAKKVLVAEGCCIHLLPCGICFASMNAETKALSTARTSDGTHVINAEDICEVEMSQVFVSKNHVVSSSQTKMFSNMRKAC
jgi:hypothetical protein